MNLERRKVLYSGRVQGVGFRWTTRRISQSHAVTGYVKNLSDGRVELVAEGTKDALNEFLGAIRGRMEDNIASEDMEQGTPTGEFTVFDIRH